MAIGDKKFPELPKSVNEIIADRAIRHALYMERYKTHVVLDLIKELNTRLEPKLVERIQKSLDRVAVTNKQLQDLFKYDGELTREEYKYIEGRLYGHLNDFAKAESSWMIKTMTETAPIAFDFALPSPAMIREIAEKQLIDGATAKQWFGKIASDTLFDINKEIRLGVGNGEGVEKIVRRIKGTRVAQYSDGKLNVARHKIRSLVRTSIANASHNVRRELYQANADVIKGVQWIITLDTKACLICANLENNGKPYDIDEVPDIPHFSCRCSTVPVLYSWKELGIDLKEAPEGTRASSAITKAERKRIRKLPAEERNKIMSELNGQVPESLTYSKWLRRQSKELQEEALGVTRAREFRGHRKNIGDFVNNEGQILTLKQLNLKD